MEIGREDTITKLEFVAWNIIVLGICYWLARYYTIYYWEYWQLDLANKIFWYSWEIGLEGLVLFTIFYLVDLNNIWFNANRLHKLMMSFFFGWFLADFNNFILFSNGFFSL